MSSELITTRGPGGHDAGDAGDAGEQPHLAERVAAAVTSSPGVAGLWPGRGTYLPGRMVPGVVLVDGTVCVWVVGRPGHPLLDVAEQVRATVRPLIPGRRIDVRFEDLEAEGG